MSATNRGAERISADFYPTPAWCVRRLLEAVSLPVTAGFTDDGRIAKTWLEPCIGDGAIVRAVDRHFRTDRPTWNGCDIREEALQSLGTEWAASVWKQDAATIGNTELSLYDVIITNPPFGLFFPIMKRLVEGAPNAHVILLGRLNLLGSGVRDGRSAWLREHAPDVYVLPNRPSFTGQGTDATEYCWFHWPAEGHNRTSGSARILAETPKQERCSK